MRKIWIILLALAVFSTACKKKSTGGEEQSAHFIVKDETGNTVENNHTFTFRTAAPQGGVLNLLITNTSASTIHLKTKLISVSGTSGQDMEFCFGNCYIGMEQGTAYPQNGTFDLNGNATSQPGEIHFINHFANGQAEYTIEIYEVDNNGNRIGDAFTFKYQYTP